MVGIRRSGLIVPEGLYQIQEFLLNVRMPVFFVLSGVFLGKSLVKHSKEKIIYKKVSKLLYPYILWSIILISIQIFLSDFTNSNRSINDFWYIVAQPRELDHMWYLLALFNSSVLLLLVYTGVLKNFYFQIILAFVLHFLHPFVSEYSLISDIFYHYIFLVAGVFMYKYIGRLEAISTKRLAILLVLIIPLFIVGQLFWLNNIDAFYQPFKLWYLLPFLIAIFIACIVYYIVSRILFQSRRATFLAWIGKYSLYIYILHILVISLTRIIYLKILHFENVAIIIITSLILGVLIPVWIYKLSEKMKINYLFSLERYK